VRVVLQNRLAEIGQAIVSIQGHNQEVRAQFLDRADDRRFVLDFG